MDTPDGPTLHDTSTLLARLAQPSSAYRRRVWAAVAGLTVFVALYFLLAAWFVSTAYHLTIGADRALFTGWVVGLAALLLAVFMLKAVFFVKHGAPQGALEITADAHPRLFAFLHELADRARAPRPHRVFVTAQVNAAVFYDLSLLNLFFPSKKDLEIGLGLVNVLTLGELRAVLAHEFGHFTQRAMAVGRWVYIAQQISAQVVSRRDQLDAMLVTLSRIDLRVAWIGWILRLVVWSIRSLVETAFRGLLLLQRALSREMEFNADLVAVSLTGSDALIHALHKLQAGDDSWMRTASVADEQLAKGRIPRDLFVMHSRTLERMRAILDDPTYGQVPPLPSVAPAAHRIFRVDTAQPPRMWLTHPPNHEREANAKLDYVARPIDEGSAWSLFDDAEALRARVTAVLTKSADAETATVEESVRAVDALFDREFLDRRYRGLYLGRSVVLAVKVPADLVGPPPDDWRHALDGLYPESLAADLTSVRDLERELSQLRALESGALQPPDGVLRHRGAAIARRNLPGVIEQVERELSTVSDRLAETDRDCRTAHLAAAARLATGWPEYLRGLHAALHYAGHTEANLLDTRGALAATFAMETATGRVGGAGRGRLIQAALRVHDALASATRRTGAVTLDARLLARVEVKAWSEAFGAYTNPPPDEGNLPGWLEVVDGWVGSIASAHASLALAGLDELLATEAAVAAHARAGSSPGPAPAPSLMPPKYETLLPGAERKREMKLGWWERFQVADGPVAAGARLLVAASIVVGVLGFGSTMGSATLTIQNGLARAVRVQLDDAVVVVEPLSSQAVAVDAGPLRIVSHTIERDPIDSLEVEVPGRFAKFVYNVAGASPLIDWTVAYGNAVPGPSRPLGAPIWLRTIAEDVLSEPPPQMDVGRSGGATRLVLSTAAALVPLEQLGYLPDSAWRRVTQSHLRWDGTGTAGFTMWWRAAASFQPNRLELLAARLAEQPTDVVLLRLEQDEATGADRSAVCARHAALAQRDPESANLAYVTARCIAGTGATPAFAAGHRRWRDNHWFANAVGYEHAERGEWAQALPLLNRAFRELPPISSDVALDMARILRLTGAEGVGLDSSINELPSLLQKQSRVRPTSLAHLVASNAFLRVNAEFESGVLRDTSPSTVAYVELAKGNLPRALLSARTDSALEARIIRLASASDGADPALIARAFALDSLAGLDYDTYWTSVALAMRVGREMRLPSVDATNAPPEAAQLRRFLALAKRRDLAGAERELEGLRPMLRGYAYTGGVIILGTSAPARWRSAAQRLLFVTERPYFRQ